MDYDGFIHRNLGKAIDWDGVYGAQCVDEVAQYCADNGKPVAYANAKDWANNPVLRPAFDWIPNDSNNSNQVPTRGDIVVFSGNSPGSGGMGHINIFDMLTNSSKTTWQGLDQNWNGAYVHFVPNHIWTYVLGWWHPKATAPANITLEQLDALYQSLLGRAPDQGGIDHYVGNYTYDFVANDIRNSAEFRIHNTPVPAPLPAPDPAPPTPLPTPVPTPTPIPTPTPDPKPTPQPTSNLKTILLAVGVAIAALLAWFISWLHN